MNINKKNKLLHQSTLHLRNLLACKNNLKLRVRKHVNEIRKVKERIAKEENLINQLIQEHAVDNCEKSVIKKAHQHMDVYKKKLFASLQLKKGKNDRFKLKNKKQVDSDEILNSLL